MGREMMTDGDAVRAAIIGCGDVSVVHGGALAVMSGVELVGVCDTDADRRAAAAQEYGVPGFTDHRTLLEAVAPDVVHVTTPHHQHASVSIDCLRAGVHVLQEKPLAHTLAAATELAEVAVSSPAKLGLCFQNRYNAPVVALRQLIDSGALGAISGAYASVVWTRTPAYYRARPWRGRWAQAGGGLLINQAIHTLDLVQWLLGDVVGVAGRATSDEFGEVSEVEDTAHALFTHASGVTTSFYATLTAPVDRPVELEIYGEHGVACLAEGLRVSWADGRVDEVLERTATSGGRSYWGVSHELLIRDFYAHLVDPERFWIGAPEGLASLRMLKAIYALSYPDRPGLH